MAVLGPYADGTPRDLGDHRAVTQGGPLHAAGRRGSAGGMMTTDELEELVTLLGSAGHALEGDRGRALAEAAPSTLEAGVQEVAAVVVGPGMPGVVHSSTPPPIPPMPLF